MCRSDKMNFGNALEALKEGKSITRKGWNGKGQFVYKITGTDFEKAFKYGYGEYHGEPRFRDSLVLKSAQNDLVVGWVPSMSDLFAGDWEVL